MTLTENKSSADSEHRAFQVVWGVAAITVALLADLDRLFANPASTVENLLSFVFLAEPLCFARPAFWYFLNIHEERKISIENKTPLICGDYGATGRVVSGCYYKEINADMIITGRRIEKSIIWHSLNASEKGKFQWRTKLY